MKVGQGDLSIDPFPLQMVEKSRLIMALGTGHLAVTGGVPGLDIGIHLMANATEGGVSENLRRPFIENNNEENDGAEDE